MDSQTAQDNAKTQTTLTNLNDTPSLAPVKMTDLGTDSGFHPAGCIQESRFIYEIESSPTDNTKTDKCQPRLAGEESDDEVLGNPNRNDEQDDIEEAPLRRPRPR